jgi:predicted permease
MKQIFLALRYSLRLCLKAPTNTLLCILVLAGGIAIVSSMFRVSRVVLLSKVPYEKSERVTLVTRVGPDNDYDVGWSIDSYRMFAKEQGVFEELLPVFGRTMAVQDNGKGHRVSMAFVGTNVAEFTGIRPILGRSFSSEDAMESSPRVVMISERFWGSMYHSDPQIIGKTMVLNGVVRTIVGVMPTIFDGPTPHSGRQIWLPMDLDTIHKEVGWNNFILFLGRIRDGVSGEMAQERTTQLAKRIYAAYPEDNRTMVAAGLRYINTDFFDENTRRMFYSLFVCAVLILLMSCGIAAGLMTARYSERTQEFAVRTALGASRSGLVFQMVLEFVMISLTATVFGLLLFHWIATSFVSPYLEQFGLPVYMLEQPQGQFYLFVLAVLLIVTLASTVLPALRASRTDVGSVMKESTRTGSSLRVTKLSNLLIVWQVASAGTILCGGVLMGNIIHRFSTQNNYYDPNEYICATLAFNPNDHGKEGVQTDCMRRIVDSFENYPEIEKAGLSTEFYGYGQTKNVWIEGVAYPGRESVPVAAQRIVSTGYFKATNVPVLIGREFEKADEINKLRVAVVTDAFARKFFGTTEVVGKRFKNYEQSPFLTIVGVVPDLFVSDGTSTRPEGFFIPYHVEPWQDVVIFAKPRSGGADMATLLPKIVTDVNDRICVSDIMPVSEYRRIYGGGLYMNFLFSLFLAFAVGALLMAAAGLYGIISFSVSSKRKDTGIRLALGASPGRIVILIAKTGMINMSIGLVFALAGAWFVSRVVTREFMGQIPSGGTLGAYVLSAVMLLVVTLTSILIPALRGASSEPSAALRDE